MLVMYEILLFFKFRSNLLEASYPQHMQRERDLAGKARARLRRQRRYNFSAISDQFWLCDRQRIRRNAFSIDCLSLKFGG